MNYQRWVAQELDQDRSQGTHETALKRLQRDHGSVSMAYLGGNEYVYYLSFDPDPDNAEYVVTEGERRELETRTNAD